MKSHWKSVLVAQCLTLCNPTRLLCPWVLQARIPEWVAILFSRFFPPRDWTWVSLIVGKFFVWPIDGGRCEVSEEPRGNENNLGCWAAWFLQWRVHEKRELHGKWQQFVWDFAMNFSPRSRWHFYSVRVHKPLKAFHAVWLNAVQWYQRPGIIGIYWILISSRVDRLTGYIRLSVGTTKEKPP